jgi:hypothetical protein
MSKNLIEAYEIVDSVFRDLVEFQSEGKDDGDSTIGELSGLLSVVLTLLKKELK